MADPEEPPEPIITASTTHEGEPPNERLRRNRFPPVDALRGVRRRHPLGWFVARRLATAVVLIVVVSMLVFVATSILPGDAVTRILGRFATTESLATLRQQLGLDEPAPERYLTWFGNLVTGDLGMSATTTQTPVWELVKGRFGNTLILAFIAMVFMLPLSIGLGTWAGIRAGRRADRVVSGITLGFIALPDFVVGAVLILVFAIWFGLLPPISLVAPGESPLADPTVLVLPIATILISVLAYTIRMVRAGVIEVMESEYVQMARLNGIPESRVVLKHALRNALAPSVQVIALTFQWLVGGVLIVETLFGYPGIGLGLVQAVQQRDITYVQSVATLIAAFYILINIASDVVVVLLVPKLRTAAQ